MTLLWTTVFVLVIFEASLVALLLLPIPYWFRRRMHSAFVRVTHAAPVRYTAVAVLVAMSLLFFNSIGEYHTQTTKIQDGVATPQQYAMMFRASRNAYLTGIFIFLLLVLLRLKPFFMEFLEVSRELQELKDQAAAKKPENAAEKSNKKND